MDYNFVTTRLATGGAIKDDKDVQELSKAGITHIIDCRLEYDDAPLLTTTSISYLFNGVNDDGKPKLPDWFKKSIEFALEALSKPKNKVYAHCAAGVNRGPSTAFAILLAQGISPMEAERMIRQARPVVGLRYKHDAISAVKTLGY
jgi:protein-tyrosine phosphatase